MRRPAADAGVNFVDEAARLLIDDLRRVRVQRGAVTAAELGPHVEPVQLQVACHQLWSTLDPHASSIQPDDIHAQGSVDEALAEFYVTQVRSVATRTGVSEREIREWIDDRLISDTGFRTQVLEGPGGADRQCRAGSRMRTSSARSATAAPTGTSSPTIASSSPSARATPHGGRTWRRFNATLITGSARGAPPTSC